MAQEWSHHGWRPANSVSGQSISFIGATEPVNGFGEKSRHSEATARIHSQSAGSSPANQSLGRESTTGNQFNDARSEAQAQGKTMESKGGSPSFEDDSPGHHTAEEPRVEHAAPPGAIGSNDAGAAGIPGPGSAPSVGPAPAEGGGEPKSAQERADQSPSEAGYGGGGSASGGVYTHDDGSAPEVAKETAKETDTAGTGQGVGAAPGMGAEGQTS